MKKLNKFFSKLFVPKVAASSSSLNISTAWNPFTGNTTGNNTTINLPSGASAGITLQVIPDGSGTVQWTSQDWNTDEDVSIEKICKGESRALDNHARINVLLTTLIISLINTLRKNKNITDKQLEESFKDFQKYVELIQGDLNTDDGEGILKRTVAESLIKLPEFLKGNL